MKQSTTVLMTAWMLTVAALVTMPALAVNTTNNAANYAESFEGYADGEFLVGTGGWYSDDTNAVVVTTTNYASAYTGGGYPIAGPHDKVLHIENNVTNRFSGPSGITNWIDHVIKPTIWDEDDYPPFPETALMAYFFNTNMNLVVLNHDSLGGGNVSNYWVDIPGIEIGSNDWLRMTIAVDFRSGGTGFVAPNWNRRYYRIWVNGEPVESPSAYRDEADIEKSPILTDVNYTNASVRGGFWFQTGTRPTGLTEIAINGTGYLDDLVATNTNPFTTANIYADVLGPAGAGTISPSGIIVVELNGGTNFVISSETYYYIHDVLIDGAPIGPTNAYTFSAVTGNRSIQAVFAAEKTDDVPHWWLNQTLGLTEDFEAALTNRMHGKPFTVWEEYWVSTNPDDPESIFRIEEVGMTNGVPYVIWYSSNIDPQLNLDENFFIIECTTNLAGNVWFDVDTVTRQGTNTWSPPTPPDGETFYRIKVDIP